MITQCCVCRKILVGGDWVDPPNEIHGEVSHGYCPLCSAEKLQEVEDYLATTVEKTTP